MKRAAESLETQSYTKFVYCRECFVKVETSKWKQHPKWCRHRDLITETNIKSTSKPPSSFTFDGVVVIGDNLEIAQKRPGNSKYDDEDWSVETRSKPIWTHLLNEDIPTILRENLEERELTLKNFREMYGNENDKGKEEFNRVKKLVQQILELREMLQKQIDCGICFTEVVNPESFYCYLTQNHLCATGGQVHIMCTSCKWALINESFFTNQPAYAHGYCQNCFADVGGNYEFISDRNFNYQKH